MHTGLATMISVMRPDIDNPDEYVRNTTARAFAVVASALGIPSLLPFLKVLIPQFPLVHSLASMHRIRSHHITSDHVALLQHDTMCVDVGCVQQ